MPFEKCEDPKGGPGWWRPHLGYADENMDRFVRRYTIKAMSYAEHCTVEAVSDDGDLEQCTENAVSYDADLEECTVKAVCYVEQCTMKAVCYVDTML